MYEDGAIIVGSVKGDRLWGKEYKFKLEFVIIIIYIYIFL